MGNKKVTIYDLAAELNISPATVSRGLNDHPSISVATKKRIMDTAKAAGYRTNKFAVNLSKRKSNTIGVIVPRLNSYFMATVLAGIEKVANEDGYNLIISQSLESEAKEKMNAKTLYDSGVDALLISLAYDTKNYEHLKIFTEQSIPVLFFDRIFDLASSPSILIDNESAGFDATQHLISQGCRNILHISGNLNRNVYADRLKGFKNALMRNGLPYTKNNSLALDLDPKNSERAIAHIKTCNMVFDGLFVANDTFAAHCIKHLVNEGFRIPEDIKVIGFNNDPVCEVVTPSLSSVDYPGYKMGILAGQSIIAQLKGSLNLQATNSIILNHKLIIRESSRNL